MSARQITSEGVSWVGRGSLTGVEFVVVAGAVMAEAGMVAGVADDEGTLLEGGCHRPSDSRSGLCGPGTSRVTAWAGRAVDKGSSEFAGPQGWFVGKRGKVIGDVLHVVVLIVVAVRGFARLGAVVGVFRRRILGTVVRELAPDGAYDGVDPIVEGAFALAF